MFPTPTPHCGEVLSIKASTGSTCDRIPYSLYVEGLYISGTKLLHVKGPEFNPRHV